MREVIERFKNIVIQIATPYSTGTGFYVPSANLIVTNDHVVRDNCEVIIDGNLIERCTAKVLYSDPQHDLAFLEMPQQVADVIPVEFANSENIQDGDAVVAVGHPMGLKFTFTQGIVSTADRIMENSNLRYVQTDAAFNPGNSGGPLVNKSGKVIGINSSIFQNTNNIGFALQVDYLGDAIQEYKKYHGEVVARCVSCANMVLESQQDSGYCGHCGAKVLLPSANRPYEPHGISRTIEDMLEQSGYDVKLSRLGPNNWEIRQGSARVYISYHEKTGLIEGDAYLALLPKGNIKPIYEFLLRQNYQIEGLTFSVNPKGQDIILSLMIYDRYLNTATGMKLFKQLFEKADYYDNVLVEQFGALWKYEAE
ncbi:MAG: trypsin-like peptidase domain-containing protein [Saprospiraceae bacterium]